MRHAAYAMVKQLFHRWNASFDLLEPKEVMMLAFATLNSFLRSATLLFLYFSWWLFLWGGFVDLRIDGNALFCRFVDYLPFLHMGISSDAVIYLLTLAFSTFFMLLSVRSSLERKTLGYFVRYTGRFIPFLLYFCFLPHVYAVPVFWLASFFLFDARKPFRSIGTSLYNGALLTLLYAPYLICVGAFHGILYHLHGMIWDIVPVGHFHLVAYAAKYATAVLLYLFFVATIHAFYVRIVQSDTTNKLFWRC